MQVQKAKQGYKIVKSLFGKYEEIPEEWNLVSLGDLCKIRKENRIESDLYIGLEHIGQGTNTLVGRGNIQQFTSTKNVFRKGDVLYGKLRPLLNKVWLAAEDGFCSTDILPITTEKLDRRILEKIISSDDFVNYASSSSAGTKMPRTNWSDIQKYEIKLAPLPEQQKIASILSNVDSLINQTQKIIEQTQRLKKGMLQKFVTDGISHDKYKMVNLGKKTLNLKIPFNWKIHKIKDVLHIRSAPLLLHPSKKYKRLIVKRRYEGVILRDEVLGKNILTKKQFIVSANDYIITHKQIIHGAGGIIPQELDGAVVSGEYSQFYGSELMSIKYFDLFARTKIFKNMIILTTQGVHIEKFVFKLNEWLNLKIPIPPISEQKKIISIVSNLDFKIANINTGKKNLVALKKGLMQKLLTGQIRVKV